MHLGQLLCNLVQLGQLQVWACSSRYPEYKWISGHQGQDEEGGRVGIALSVLMTCHTWPAMGHKQSRWIPSRTISRGWGRGRGGGVCYICIATTHGLCNIMGFGQLHALDVCLLHQCDECLCVCVRCAGWRLCWWCRSLMMIPALSSAHVLMATCCAGSWTLT